MKPAGDVETILIVDDEESVRRTVREWLEGAGLGCKILAAADAEAALLQANQQPIDLAILDWNLGAGNDGLRLLEDLTVFHPDVVAIMITGYAQQATPLDAMRMGVRDYLDKNQDFNRETFLRAVRKQLDRIRPARRERRLHRELLSFREAVGKVLPLVQTAAALNDPVPLPTAIGTLFRFLLRTTGAKDGVLLVHGYDESRQPPEIFRAHDIHGNLMDVRLIPFARSVAGTAVSLQEPSTMVNLEQSARAGAMELQSFEKGRASLLAAPLGIAPGFQVVLELFDKQGAAGFTDADRHLAAAAADFGAELLRHGLAERQTHRVLFDAMAAALHASEAMTATLAGQPASGPDDPPSAAVLEQLRAGFARADAPVDAEETLRLVEAVRVLAIRHGSRAVGHCVRLVESLRELLDDAAGEGRP